MNPIRAYHLSRCSCALRVLKRRSECHAETIPRRDRVEDTETGFPGTVRFLYESPELRDEIIVVRFDVGDDPVAVPIDSIRPQRSSQRRRRSC
jgi:hypothetical protein